MRRTFWGRAFVASSALAVLALALFSVRLMENRGEAQAAKPQATAPDFSGIWLGKGIQSLSPSDPMGKKTNRIGTGHFLHALGAAKAKGRESGDRTRPNLPQHE